MTTTKNQAAWIPAKGVVPLRVGDAPYTPPGPGQIVIKNAAVGINPFDWVVQYQGGTLASHLKYPTVIGFDVAGTVVEVGPDVTRFQVGDRVAGTAVSMAKESNDPAEGAWQHYPVLRAHMVAPVPDSVTDEQAAVLGLGVSTAAYGLFHRDYLGLDPPQVPPPTNPQRDQKSPRAIIVTGGASSVGASAIQLAASAGYEVVSTCSPKNFAYVKRLGASHVFDYNSPSLVADLVDSLQERELVGAYTVGDNADAVCAAVMTERLAKTPELPTRRFISMAGGSGVEPDTIKGFLGLCRMVSGMMTMMCKNALKKMITGIEIKFIMMEWLMDPESCVSRIYGDFLGPALAERQFVPAPEPQVVGRGLDKINDALLLNQKGVSARKIVVSLP